MNRMSIEEKVTQMLCVWQQKQTTLFDGHGGLDF
jgi:hypothetical protein